VSSFFFQAEDGIRDFHVTGVQTCALPISTNHLQKRRCRCHRFRFPHSTPHGCCSIWAITTSNYLRKPNFRLHPLQIHTAPGPHRSEERRVGKESRSQKSKQQKKKKQTRRR